MDTVFRFAHPDDIDALLDLQRPYYEVDGYPFREAVARSALEKLISDPTLGSLWVADDRGNVVGYLAVTLGFSLEYGGRDAFIDELVFAESHRGRGLGSRALKIAEGYARENGVQALHLEVERRLGGARRLYLRSGFVDGGRALLTRRLEDSPS